MPIYEFRCKDCGNVSEFQMKMSDPNPVDCPTCGHPALSKIMSLPSFQLKGGGWYSDAYDGKSNKPGSASSSSDAPAAASSAAATPTAASSPSPSPSPSSPAPAAASASSSPSSPSSGGKGSSSTPK